MVHEQCDLGEKRELEEEDERDHRVDARRREAESVASTQRSHISIRILVLMSSGHWCQRAQFKEGC